MLRLERKRNFVPVLNNAVRRAGTWGSGGTAPHILNIGSRRKGFDNLSICV
jgi:hypothetical protein